MINIYAANVILRPQSEITLKREYCSPPSSNLSDSAARLGNKCKLGTFPTSQPCISRDVYPRFVKDPRSEMQPGPPKKLILSSKFANIQPVLACAKERHTTPILTDSFPIIHAAINPAEIKSSPQARHAKDNIQKARPSSWTI